MNAQYIYHDRKIEYVVIPYRDYLSLTKQPPPAGWNPAAWPSAPHPHPIPMGHGETGAESARAPGSAAVAAGWN